MPIALPVASVSRFQAMLTFLRSQRALGRRDGPACTRAEADLLRRRVV